MVSYLRKRLTLEELGNLAADTEKRVEMECFLGLDALFAGRRGRLLPILMGRREGQPNQHRGRHRRGGAVLLRRRRNRSSLCSIRTSLPSGECQRACGPFGVVGTYGRRVVKSPSGVDPRGGPLRQAAVRPSGISVLYCRSRSSDVLARSRTGLRPSQGRVFPHTPRRKSTVVRFSHPFQREARRSPS